MIVVIHDGLGSSDERYSRSGAFRYLCWLHHSCKHRYLMMYVSNVFSKDSSSLRPQRF